MAYSPALPMVYLEEMEVDWVPWAALPAIAAAAAERWNSRACGSHFTGIRPLDSACVRGWVTYLHACERRGVTGEQSQHFYLLRSLCGAGLRGCLLRECTTASGECWAFTPARSEEHTSELQSLMRIS